MLSSLPTQTAAPPDFEVNVITAGSAEARREPCGVARRDGLNEPSGMLRMCSCACGLRMGLAGRKLRPLRVTSGSLTRPVCSVTAARAVDAMPSARAHASPIQPGNSAQRIRFPDARAVKACLLRVCAGAAHTGTPIDSRRRPTDIAACTRRPSLPIDPIREHSPVVSV